MNELHQWYKESIIKEFNKLAEGDNMRKGTKIVTLPIDEIDFRLQNGEKADKICDEFDVPKSTLYYHLRKHKDKIGIKPPKSTKHHRQGWNYPPRSKRPDPPPPPPPSVSKLNGEGRAIIIQINIPGIKDLADKLHILIDRVLGE